MATFCYRIRSTRKNKLVKVQILFTVGRGNRFYVDSQYLVLTDAWDSKRQSVKSRFNMLHKLYRYRKCESINRISPK